MKQIGSIIALSLGALSLFGCRQGPAVTLTPENAETLSGCVVTFRANVDPPVSADDTGRFSWFVDGERVPDEHDDMMGVSRKTGERTSIAVTVRYAKGIARSEATARVSITPVPFRDPRECGLAFSERPVIARDADQLVDPGAMAWDDGMMRTVYNAIASDNAIYFGYAESEDGLAWKRMNGISNPLHDKASVARAIGVKPNNIHARTLRREETGWVLYFTAANAGDYFFGNVFRATAKEPAGPWTIDPAPCFPGTMENWFSGDRGLPQVFDAGNGGLRMYCATRSGGLVLAETTGPGKFTVTAPAAPGLFLPAIAKTSWGWVLASGERLYLSVDGRSWHRYASDLYSPKDLDDRGIESVMITALVEHEGKYRYYFEGMSDSQSDVWLIRWGD